MADCELLFMDTFQPPKSTWWEGVAIAAGGVTLVAIALAGLALKAFDNAFDPQRSEAIARSFMRYQIPGGSRGVFGFNLGGSKIALVTSHAVVEDLKKIPELDDASRAEIQLWIARVPVERTTDAEDSPETADENLSLSSSPHAGFTVTQTRVQQKSLCGRQVPVKLYQGTLQLSDRVPPVPALRYDTSAFVETEEEKNEYQVTLIAIGSNFEAKAETVFNSLQCHL